MIDTIYKIAEIIYSSLRYYASTDVKELTRVYSLVCLFPSPVHKYKPIQIRITLDKDLNWFTTLLGKAQAGGR